MPLLAGYGMAVCPITLQTPLSAFFHPVHPPLARVAALKNTGDRNEIVDFSEPCGAA